MKEREAIRALRSLGFTPEDPDGTSHRHWRLIRNGRLFKVTLDPHNGEVKANDVRSMIKQAGVSKKQWYRAAAGREIEPSQAPAAEASPESED